MHAQGTACHWCPAGTGSGLAAIGGPAARAAAVLVAIGLSGAMAWTYRVPLQGTVSATVASARATFASPRSAASGEQSVVASTAGVSVSSTPATSAPAPTAVPTQIAVVAPPGDVAPAALPDTVQWVPAVARTWVNVRTNEGRDAEVVGIIKPASRAMLGGTGRAGWRQVRSDSMTGWVNPKHFDADSARTRG
ncbi:MAG: hypothetical protein V4617_14085 [Gemmatimonadota bacterium]